MASIEQTALYSEALDAQLDLAGYYASAPGKQVVANWGLLYDSIPRERRPNGAWDVARGLLNASPVYLDPRIGRMLEDALPTFPEDAELHPEDLIIPHGFLWLGGTGWPLHTTVTPLNQLQSMRGFAWSVDKDGIAFAAFGPSRHANAHRQAIRPPIRGTVDSPTNAVDHRAPLHRLGLDRGHRSGEPLNQMHLLDTWNWGEKINDRSGAGRALLASRGDLAEVESLVPRVGRVDWHMAQDSLDERALNARRIAYAIWHFMGQRIAVTSTHRVNRAAARRAERAGWTHEPVVQIIELRRKAYERLDRVEEASRTYRVQWVVGHHWRSQWYPSLQRHKPLWIEAYVKGPAGAPMQGGTKLFAVTR